MRHISINLNSYHNVYTIIRAFNSIKKLDNIRVRVLHRKDKFIDVAIYPVLCSIINERRAHGAVVLLEFDTPLNCSQLTYAERMNFLSCLGLDYPYPYSRKTANGRFIEIFHISVSNYFYPTNLEEVFGTNFGLLKPEIESIVFVLGELGCNCTMHSKSKNGAYFFCQKYPQGEYLDVHIVDSGIGIINSMLNNSDNKSLKPKELLALSIVFGKGSGHGRGHGLYFVSEFLRRNRGYFEIITGNSYLKVVNGETIIDTYDSSYEGVIINMKIPFRIVVPITELMNEKY